MNMTIETLRDLLDGAINAGLGEQDFILLSDNKRLGVGAMSIANYHKDPEGLEAVFVGTEVGK
jgi:hypothetical protein